jgi:hypothetical protein
MGRPPVADDRVRFSCRLDPELDRLLRQELADRAVVSRERVQTADGNNRILDSGDIVGAALRLYFGRAADRVRKGRR